MLRLEIDGFYKNFTGELLILMPNQDFASGKLKGEKVLNRFPRVIKSQPIAMIAADTMAISCDLIIR